jgi:hypothetical protein
MAKTLTLFESVSGQVKKKNFFKVVDYNRFQNFIGHDFLNNFRRHLEI